MPAAKLPRELVLRWLAEGVTQYEIVDRLREEYNILTTQSAVSMLKIRHADPDMEAHMRTRVRATQLPWHVKAEHRQLHAAKMLRAKSRLDRGESIPPIQLRQLQTWIAGLEADNAVIHYQPETDQGFWRVPRRDGVDVGLIANPEVAYVS